MADPLGSLWIHGFLGKRTRISRITIHGIVGEQVAATHGAAVLEIIGAEPELELEEVGAITGVLVEATIGVLVGEVLGAGQGHMTPLLNLAQVITGTGTIRDRVPAQGRQQGQGQGQEIIGGVDLGLLAAVEPGQTGTGDRQQHQRGIIMILVIGEPQPLPLNSHKLLFQMIHTKQQVQEPVPKLIQAAVAVALQPAEQEVGVTQVQDLRVLIGLKTFQPKRGTKF